MNESKPAEHDGEYVLTTDGIKDFGEIRDRPELQDGTIRLRIGKEEGEKGDYGEKHIDRPDRLAQLKQHGYHSARDMTEFVAKDYDAIYPSKSNALTIVRKQDVRHNAVIYVEFEPVADGFYDVKGGLIASIRHFKKMTPLWEKPHSGNSNDGTEATSAPQHK
jgi:hypothetical protein